MMLIDGIVGQNVRITNIKENNLCQRLMSLGICNGDKCCIINKSNGNIILKTEETKLIISENLADKVVVEVLV